VLPEAATAGDDVVLASAAELGAAGFEAGAGGTGEFDGEAAAEGTPLCCWRTQVSKSGRDTARTVSVMRAWNTPQNSAHCPE
jgi:hypothetical protein